MKKGIIYLIFDWLIENLKYLNLVELFKFLAKEVYKRDEILASRAGVDLFIIIKWVAIILFWNFNIRNEYVNIIVAYLIITNIYTYFYYHTWTKALNDPHFDLDRIKRRFLSLLMAVSYNIFAFGYLYNKPFYSNFKWIDTNILATDAIKFSFANALITSYEPVIAINRIGHTLVLLETITSFIFLTIILSNSIPQIKN